MSYLRCNSCGNFEEIPANKYKAIGIGVSCFGIFGWFSFFFAGSGHALLISCVIVIAGIICFNSAKKIGIHFISEERCPSCHKKDWDQLPYNSKTSSGEK